MSHTTSRRRFLSDTFSVVSSVSVGAAWASLGGRLSFGEGPQGKSPLVDVKDETTGLPLLRLPEGFRYQSFGWTGDKMSDGISTPGAHDGMGVIQDENGVLTLIRNHEASGDGGHISFGSGQPYDSQAYGGCTSLKFDTKSEKFIDSRVAISGTSRNCAGGVTPWGTWLTCEETVLGPSDIDRYQNDEVRKFKKDHGWIFEVSADGTRNPVPYKAMGRFVHEAVAIDRETGIVYETEDRGTSGFYRFVPNKVGELAAGGTLEIAEVVGQKDLRGGFANGTQFPVRWHKIPNPELASTPGKGKPDELGVFKQGEALGGSIFARLEGCWAGNDLIYFDATSGGAAQAGQIWQYDPKAETLTLLFESPSKPTLNMPDNLCVRPQGNLMLCEDNNYGITEFPQRVFHLTQDGKLSLFAENNVWLKKKYKGFMDDYRTKEWAGACFSPDGEWMFVNIQSPGITLAITGPWNSLTA